jgi:hypothetical protein
MVDNMSGRGGSKVDRTDDAGVSDMASGDGPIGDQRRSQGRRRTGGQEAPMGRIALGWLKDESFYKDITTRALAAGIVALGAYFFALGAGYVSTPGRKRRKVL